MAAWNAGKTPRRAENPPINCLSLTPLTSSLGVGGVCFIALLLAAEFQPNKQSQQRCDAARAGKHPRSSSPFSQRGIHYKNKPHSFQGHLLAVSQRERERLEIVISTSESLSVSHAGGELTLVQCVTQWRREEWARLYEAARPQEIRVLFLFRF